MADALPTPMSSPAWSDPWVVAAHYRELLTTGHDSICEALAILTDSGAYPVLVHCSAGKDRTGVLCAIVLGVLGVPDQLIIDDYAFERARDGEPRRVAPTARTRTRETRSRSWRRRSRPRTRPRCSGSSPMSAPSTGR